MKYIKTASIFLIISITSSLFFSSCEKDKMIPPELNFTTGSGYVSADTGLAVSTEFKIGVVAKRTEANDDLKTFTVTQSYDGGPETTVESITIPAAQAAEFTKEYTFTTRNVTGTEKYTFTVTNRDGLITTKSVTITVH
ncbi:MAG: hypothetical protein ICV66_14345 [Chitinophagaceae bacterium]|nr:hypothetical protein [Chitinophagaceae bacterium]